MLSNVYFQIISNIFYSTLSTVCSFCNSLPRGGKGACVRVCVRVRRGWGCLCPLNLSSPDCGLSACGRVLSCGYHAGSGTWFLMSCCGLMPRLVLALSSWSSSPIKGPHPRSTPVLPGQQVAAHHHKPVWRTLPRISQSPLSLNSCSRFRGPHWIP